MPKAGGITALELPILQETCRPVLELMADSFRLLHFSPPVVPVSVGGMLNPDHLSKIRFRSLSYSDCRMTLSSKEIDHVERGLFVSD